MPVEKNDVEISQLFNWGRVFEVVGNDSDSPEALVYMRLLGDADLNRARVYALRRSAELRNNLHKEGSDDNLVLIKPMDIMTERDIMNYIGAFSIREVRNDAFRNVKLPRPVAPKSSASLAKLEKYQKQLDEYPAKLEAELRKYMKKQLDVITKSLEGKPKEELYKMYKDALINELCEQEALRAFNDMSVYLGCYRDDNYNERFFESFEKFDNLEPTIKQQFRAAYSSLEIPQDELKKLREATP